MSEDSLQDMINSILADPNFVVRVNNRAIMGKRGGLGGTCALPANVQSLIGHATFDTETLQRHFARAAREVRSRKTVVGQINLPAV